MGVGVTSARLRSELLTQHSSRTYEEKGPQESPVPSRYSGEKQKKLKLLAREGTAEHLPLTKRSSATGSVLEKREPWVTYGGGA